MKTKTQDPRIAQKVLEMVADHYKTTPEKLKSVEGDPMAKKVVMYVLKEGLGASLKAAREAVNKKHDPDVYLAVKKIKALLRTDTTLAKMIEEAKAEALMIVAVPSGAETTSPSEPTSTSRKSAPSDEKTPAIPGKSEAIPSGTLGNTTQVIETVQKAVTSIFLGANLLQSPDPAAEVMFAKDAVVFLVWDDFPKINRAEILKAFHLDQDGLYRAIGRISVCLKESGSELKKKLKAARAGYSAA